MVPPAPPRFSTSTGWPSASEILPPTRRAMKSAAPPGGTVTIRRIGRLGKSPCAETAPANAIRNTAPRARMEPILSTALEQPRAGQAERQSPERRADAEDRDVGHGDHKADQRAEAEAPAEGRVEGRLQHAQHRKAGER